MGVQGPHIPSWSGFLVKKETPLDSQRVGPLKTPVKQGVLAER